MRRMYSENQLKEIIKQNSGTKLYKHVFTDKNANQITFISNNETYDFSTSEGRKKFRDDLMVFGGIIGSGQVLAASSLSASQIQIYFWSVLENKSATLTVPFAGITVETTIL